MAMAHRGDLCVAGDLRDGEPRVHGEQILSTWSWSGCQEGVAGLELVGGLGGVTWLFLPAAEG